MSAIRDEEIVGGEVTRLLIHWLSAIGYRSLVIAKPESPHI